MSSNKTMKNKLVNTMRVTRAGVSAEPEEPVAADKSPSPVKKAKTTKKTATKKPASSGYSSGCRVWPD